MRPLHRAKANRFLAAAKEIIGHCHAPLTVQRKEEFTIDWIFNELKRVFTADNIRSGQGGKLQDLSSVKYWLYIYYIVIFIGFIDKIRIQKENGISCIIG